MVVYILILTTQTLRQENSKSEANLGILARFFLKLNKKYWGNVYNSLVEPLPSMCETLGKIPVSQNTK